MLREKYKIDPVFAEKVNEQYGPLDWRLPEAHAIYWGALGLEKAKENPDKVKADDLITLRRIIYQSMLQAFYHGRFIANPFNKSYELGPNLGLIPKVNDAYETMMQEDEKNRDHIATAHRNFLRNAVYFLYEDNRVAEAAKWFRYLGEKYPDKPIIDGDPNSFPRNLTLDEYAVARVQADIERHVAGTHDGGGCKACSPGPIMNWPSGRTTAMPDSSCSPEKFMSITRLKFPARKATCNAWACPPSPISIAPCSTNCLIRNKAHPTPCAPSFARNWECRRKPMRPPWRFRRTRPPRQLFPAMHPPRGRQVPPNKLSGRPAEWRRKMIKRPEHRHHPCAPASIRRNHGRAL